MSQPVGTVKDEGGRMKDESKPESASSFILHPSSFRRRRELAFLRCSVCSLLLCWLYLTGVPPSLLNDAHPVTGPERPPESPPSAQALWWAAVFGTAIVIAAALILRRRRRAAEPSPHEWAQTALDRLIRQNGAPEELADELSAVLRGYAERRFGIAAGGMTTAEIICHLDGLIPNARNLHDWRDLLNRCDLAKFAGAPLTASESARVLQRAQQLLSASLSSSELAPAAKTGEVRSVDQVE
jgi:hypothetical protein